MIKKKLVQDLDAYDAKTFQNQIVWADTSNASSSSYDGSDNVDHHDFIQVLCPTWTYHFNDACACFTKDADIYSFIKRPISLLTILEETTYDLNKMEENEFKDHVTKLHDAQKERKSKMEEELASGATTKEKVMDDNIVHEIIIDLTNISVMNEVLMSSNIAIADEVDHQDKETTSKQSTTSNKSMSMKQGALDAVIAYSTSLGPTTLNYTPPFVVSKDQVQEMIGQAMYRK